MKFGKESLDLETFRHCFIISTTIQFETEDASLQIDRNKVTKLKAQSSLSFPRHEVRNIQAMSKVPVTYGHGSDRY